MHFFISQSIGSKASMLASNNTRYPHFFLSCFAVFNCEAESNFDILVCKMFAIRILLLSVYLGPVLSSGELD